MFNHSRIRSVAVLVAVSALIVFCGQVCGKGTSTLDQPTIFVDQSTGDCVLRSEDVLGEDVVADGEVAPCEFCQRKAAKQRVCGCDKCKKKAAKPNPCAKSHKVVYYANDFSYLKDPGYNGCCLGDALKLMPVGCCGQWGTLDIGGQLRLRYHHEHGMGRQAGVSGFNDTQNDFNLTRLRLYTNWKVNDRLRLFAEGISADALANDRYLPRPIDRNSADFLNLFVDVGVTDRLTTRVGRQELIYGAQRHISPLDWANTRRTFEGIKMMYKGDSWDIDGFYTNYVRINAHNFDEADYDQSFYGVYASHAHDDGPSIDLFYLGYDNQLPYAAAPTVASAGSADFSVHTFGSRIYGSEGSWLYDFEGAVQTGRQSGLGRDHQAGMYTCGFGRKIDACWSPSVWVYYDYASGDDQQGSFNRYNQLFPLAHKYLGFIDAVQRANISSPNVLVKMAPSKKLSLLCWYYYFGAAEASDTIPVVATPSVQTTTTKYFGHELDLIATYKCSARSNVQFGYSTLWRGSKIIGTDDAHFFYSQWELNF